MKTVEQKEQRAQGLGHILADTYTVYLKTQKFHWNVTGPHFQNLHALFETQYQALALAIDEIAEAIRALGFPAPGSYTEFMNLSTLKESLGSPSSMEMVAELLKDHEALLKDLEKVFDQAAAANDQGCADVLTQRIRAHEKMVWMLKSTLG